MPFLTSQFLRVNKCIGGGGASKSEDYKFDRSLAQDLFSE